MLPRILSFVDIETTGTSIAYSRIIEIGILRFEQERLVEEFSTLINPLTRIDPYIEKLTGISQFELEKAPVFEEVKDKILEILSDSIFVAHNVRFDYGFIRNEFKRVGIPFFLKQMCTVKLARRLYPGYSNYNLDNLIENFHLKCKNRHRALDDAKVIYQFYIKSLKDIENENLEKAINIVMKRPSIPLGISEKELDRLPESCGVYLFYGSEDTPIYIGKSLNIRDRVLSHFSGDHLSSKEMNISRQIKRIDVIKTAGELGAFLLESKLIKKYLPLYNRQLRFAGKMIALEKGVNKDGYNIILEKTIDEIEPQQLEKIVGVFRTKKQIKDFFFDLAPKYNLCYKLLNIEKTDRYCFAYHLGKCFGACRGKENRLKYNLRFDEAFYKLKIKSWPFNSPIIIKETGDLEEYFIVDKWCYLGSIKNHQDGEREKLNYKFDYDTYKILRKYLEKPKNLRNIKTKELFL